MGPSLYGEPSLGSSHPPPDEWVRGSPSRAAVWTPPVKLQCLTLVLRHPMPRGHLCAIARVFFCFFLSMGLFGLSVGQSPSLSLSLSPSPFRMHCAGRVLKEKFSPSSPLVQVFVFSGKSPELLINTFFCWALPFLALFLHSTCFFWVFVRNIFARKFSWAIFLRPFSESTLSMESLWFDCTFL